jgi:hypothetical protein
MGSLTSILATMPHPQGDIRVNNKETGRQACIVIDIPVGVVGELEWEGKIYPLEQGRKEFNLN